ncbi:alpha/beta hydrolase [Gimesia aquarii]|uniref:Esterase n=1 Tax=Gimesia aquarii TaxID=2527964 RepID=A0A517W0A3_9PLAN|nr:alpha/beta hydrolase-fold protein [Gimesia aquarii]QDT98678.1 Putative esterase [Gimesia aquarii]
MQQRLFLNFLIIWIVLSLLSFNAGFVMAENPKTKETKLETEELFPRILGVTFFSQNLKQRKRAVVVLPKHRQQIKQQKRRMLVILHGRGRHELSLIEDKGVRKQLLDSGLFVILPDGDDGWYINSPVRKSDVYEMYLEEVLAVVTQEFQLPTARQQWAIAGWSMGGFGCVNFAARHPDRFIAVSSMIGLLDFPRNGLPKGQSYRVPTARFGSDEAVWKQFNPIERAEKLKGMCVLIVTADKAFDRTMNEHFRERLIELKQPPEWIMLKGRHTFSVVSESIPLMLEFTKRAFQI